jgi:hypothetical protein
MNFIKINAVNGALQHANAAMPYSLLYRDGKRVGELKARGLFIGAEYGAYDIRPEQVEAPFEDGDVLVVLSDGVLEAWRPNGPLFGPKGVDEAVKAAWGQSPEEIADAILRAADRHSGRRNESPDDDQTVIVVELFHVYRVPHDARAAGVTFDGLKNAVLRRAEYPLGFTERRRKQVWIAVEEAAKNAVPTGSKPGQEITFQLAPTDRPDWLGVELTQPTGWDWASRLTEQRRETVKKARENLKRAKDRKAAPDPSDVEVLEGGTALILLIADRIDVSEDGRRLVMQFSPEEKV